MVAIKTKTLTKKSSCATQNAVAKLLKYDLKWIYKVLGPLYLATLACAILGRLLDLLQDSFLFSIIRTILIGASITLMINIYINTMARIWVRFARNLYGDESYLTHTLPVSSKTIFRAKTLAAAIAMLTTLAVIVLSFIICYVGFYNGIDLIGFLGSSIQVAASTLGLSTPILVLLLFLAIFAQTMIMILSGYAGIILGHRFNQHKTFKSILLGIVFYFMSQLIAVVMLLVLSLFAPNMMELIVRGRSPSFDILRAALISITGLYAIYTGALYHLGQKFLAWGVDVD